jgi:hypothetical protein
MPRRDGEVFFFGTAMAISSNTAAPHARRIIETLREAGLIEEGSLKR